jgi:hypothetical protein
LYLYCKSFSVKYFQLLFSLPGNMSCHPSLDQISGLLREDFMVAIRGVECAQFVVSSKDEKPHWKPGHEVEHTLRDVLRQTHVLPEAPTATLGSLCAFYEYPGERHGFVTRGDTKIDATRIAIDDIMSKMAIFVRSVEKVDAAAGAK